VCVCVYCLIPKTIRIPLRSLLLILKLNNFNEKWNSLKRNHILRIHIYTQLSHSLEHILDSPYVLLHLWRFFSNTYINNLHYSPFLLKVLKLVYFSSLKFLTSLYYISSSHYISIWFDPIAIASGARDCPGVGLVICHESSNLWCSLPGHEHPLEYIPNWWLSLELKLRLRLIHNSAWSHSSATSHLTAFIFGGWLHLLEFCFSLPKATKVRKDQKIENNNFFINTGFWEIFHLVKADE
jgi:hypothetical protein